PNAVVLGLSQNPVTGLLVAATHGRGIFAITTGAPANAVPRFRSVANAAGFEAGPLAPGMVASLFGSNLAASTATAAGVPLPSSLAGVALLVNNVAAPLFFVSPGQINFQVPYEVAAESIVELRLANAAGAAVMQVPWRPASPGIYQNAGRGVILHSGGSLVSESAPAARGEELVMYVSGLGVVAPATASGVPAPLSPLALTPSLPLVRVGGLVAETRFSGLAPGFVGLYQVNFVVPPGAAGQTTVSLVMNGVPSNTVPLHVQP
ncbi:MAG TPA: hypothetical protein VNN17_11875, partial [Terriglobia bacterium]|nr:hypothetical protein [Terriglobia bacterium]